MKQMGSLLARLRTLVVGLLVAGCATMAQADEGFKFDHFKTGFALEGAHAEVECESCHTKGVFEGTPNQCVNCHMEGGPIGASSKHTKHIPTLDTCDDCHTTQEWTFVARVDHASTLGQCVGCHDRFYAQGQPDVHVRNTGECDACHITQEWAEVRFDHDVVNTDSCIACHDGVVATGQSAMHIKPVDPTCESCHFTTQWSPVITVDHTAIPTENCASCHGSTASGKPPNHILVVDAAPCEDCHKDTMVWFVEPTMGVDHDHVMGSCVSCHNNQVARGQPANHDERAGSNTSGIPCSSCHQVNDGFRFRLP